MCALTAAHRGDGPVFLEFVDTLLHSARVLFIVMFTAPGGDAFAADGESVNFLLFGGTAHLRCRVGIGDPNRPQVSWRRAFGNTRQYPAIRSRARLCRSRAAGRCSARPSWLSLR
ncbi:hypothetical protein [Burkholderia cepacia]|uniref:hypothetical protein n=1 Tax=Burkholderia cepacia TaxID=292 RepID=UPI000A6B2ACA|nr:hypothetical protein [Burkholderia cepacia]